MKTKTLKIILGTVAILLFVLAIYCIIEIDYILTAYPVSLYNHLDLM